MEVGLQLINAQLRRRAAMVTGQVTDRGQVTLVRPLRKTTLLHGLDHLVA